MKRVCNMCLIEKDLENFYPTKNGYLPKCKECSKKLRREYYKANRKIEQEKSLARHHEYQKEVNYRERRKKYQKEYNQDYMHRPEILEKKKEWINRYRSKIHIKISKAISFQVWFTLRSKLDGKNGKCNRHWEDLVEYTIEELMEHLEKQFRDGMTWENYGGDEGWQIDHKIPKSTFNIKVAGDDEFKKCWSLDNLQPLWLKENASKGARYSGQFRPEMCFV